MGLFSVTTTIKAVSGVNVVFVFRTPDGIETLDQLADELSEHGVVVGDRFRVIAPRNGERGRLVDRREIMLTREGIASAVLFENIEDFDIYE